MKLVPSSVSRSIARSVLKTKINSPHIFFGAGIAGIVGSTVLACRATLKVEPILDEIKTDFDAVTNMSGYEELGSQKYTSTQYRKDVGYVYMKGGMKIVKLYAPAVIVGGVAIAALTSSHIQLTKRNKELAATLGAVLAAYDAYRARVREEFGEEKELEIYRDVKEETVEVDGKKQKVKSANPSKYSVFAKYYGPQNPNWYPSTELNRNFIQCQQEYANHILQARGHVLLNDVYDALGLERTTPGSVVGWVRDPKGDGDGYIDFHIFEGFNERIVGDHEAGIWLDFNVDGVVNDLIGDYT